MSSFETTSRVRVRRGGNGFRRQLATGGALAVLASAGLGVVFSGEAQAATPGQYTVGTTPVALTQPSDALLGRATPTADADTKGMFGPQIGWGTIPVNVALLANGHLVSYGTPLSTAQQGGVTYDDWNPALGMVDFAHTQVASMASYNSFCNSLATLPDGRLLMVGGNGDGTSNKTMYYDPITKAESMGPGLNGQRWYATTLRRPNDQIAVIGGGDYYAVGAYQDPTNNGPVRLTPEVGSGTGAWTSLTGATSADAFSAKNNHWWYPRAFNAPDGSVFGISGEQLWSMTTSGSGNTSLKGTLPNTPGVSGAAVMYAPGKILVAGGGEVANGTAVTATNAATVIDISTSTPTVTSVAPMTYKRQWDNAAVLPTGEVFVNGGTIVGTNGGAANSSSTSEIWNPQTQTWRLGATAQRIRTYHSTSVLMPSGMVLTGGGGVPGPEDNFNVEPYYPSSLFTRDANNAVVWASRPTLTSLSGNLTWGGSLTLGSADTRAISSVSLINAGSVTHSQNTDQRRVPLTFTQNGSSLSVALPSDKNALPPGTYLLSVVDSKGVPSPSQLVTIRNGGAGSVTVYEADQSAVNGIGGPGPAVTGSVPLTVGSSVGFEAVNFAGYRIRQQNGALRIDPISATSSNGDKVDSSFVVRAGLASATGFSFESVATPGAFIKVENGTAVLRANDKSAAFAANATFVAVHGLTGQNTSLALYGDQKQYLRHANYVLYAQPFDGSDVGRHDATFNVRAAFTTGGGGGGGTSPVLSQSSQTSGAAATFSQGSGSYSITGSGTDMWVGVDQYAALYQQGAAAVGSSVTARVDSQTNTDPWAKAGVVLRNSVPGAKTSPGYAVMVLTPGNGVSFQWDSNGNGDLDSYVAAAAGAKAPQWVRLTRVTATTVAGYYSTDGTTWTQVGATATVPGAATTQDAGLVMTSHNATTAGTATFSQYAVAGGTTTAPVLSQSSQTSGAAATFSQGSGSYSITGSGTDMWVGVDQYAALYQQGAAAVGSSVTARVDSQTNTDPWAKAGVVLRNSVPGAKTSPGYAVMVLTPGNGVSFQWDSNGNGDLDSYVAAAAGAKAPTWVRLTRVSATTVAGYYSTDGSTWTQVGATATVPGAGTTQDAGLVMTSHNATTAGTATFSQYKVQ